MAKKSILFNLWYANRNLHVHCNDRILRGKQWLKKHPEFDGYEAMERLVQDPTVSQSARAKAYYMLTGRQLPMGSITGYTTETDEHGNIYVKAMTANGEVEGRCEELSLHRPKFLKEEENLHQHKSTSPLVPFRVRDVLNDIKITWKEGLYNTEQKIGLPTDLQNGVKRGNLLRFCFYFVTQ